MSSENAVTSKNEWDLIIRPQRSWWDLRLGELWRYRDLVWRDFVATYKQTNRGPIWYLIQPILTTVIFTAIFGNIAKLSPDG
jgi:lipopolysaccharide transport system permease protein